MGKAQPATQDSTILLHVAESLHDSKIVLEALASSFSSRDMMMKLGIPPRYFSVMRDLQARLRAQDDRLRSWYVKRHFGTLRVYFTDSLEFPSTRITIPHQPRRQRQCQPPTFESRWPDTAIHWCGRHIYKSRKREWGYNYRSRHC